MTSSSCVSAKLKGTRDDGVEQAAHRHCERCVIPLARVFLRFPFIAILASFCTVPVAVVIEPSSKIPLAVLVSCAVFFWFPCGNRAMDRRSAMVLLNTSAAALSLFSSR